ncbi:MAG: hypothetical protein ABI557_17665, partial [Aureliella sp.]
MSAGQAAENGTSCLREIFERLSLIAALTKSCDSIFCKPFLPIGDTENSLYSITRYHSTPYELQKTENGY